MTSDGRTDESSTPQEGAAPRARRLPATTDMSSAALQVRRERLRDDGYTVDALAGDVPEPGPEALAGSIEGFIGTRA